MYSYIKNKLKKIEISYRYFLSKKKIKRFSKELTLKQIINKYQTRTEIYKYFHHYFWHYSPKWLKEHRDYFSKEQRGFGEDAFHAMWYYIFKEYNPEKILEIGVYRGQTLSLFSLLSEKFETNANIHGISPFNPSGDNVSNYLKNLDYYRDVKENTEHFNLAIPSLHKGYSTDQKMKEIIELFDWNLIYIDGNHNYKTVKSDFIVCSESLKKGGLIVLDDSTLYTDYEPPCYSFAGHPGPSRVANEIDPKKFKEILCVGHNRVFQKI